MSKFKKGGKKDVEVFVKPAFTDNGLMYKRWVKQREAKVAELSGGKVGYVHVEGMNSPSFRTKRPGKSKKIRSPAHLPGGA